MKNLSNQRGLTLIELILVVGIIVLLFGIGFVGITNIQVLTARSTAATVLISDIRNQQIKAMVGDTEGRASPDNYGVKLLSDEYVLFHGNNYDPTNPDNYTIPLPDAHGMTSTFPNDEIVFASDSGELVSFLEGSNTVTIINNPSSTSETITLNQYGVVTNFQ